MLLVVGANAASAWWMIDWGYYLIACVNVAVAIYAILAWRRII